MLKSVYIFKNVEYFLSLNIKFCLFIKYDAFISIVYFEEITEKIRARWKLERHTLNFSFFFFFKRKNVSMKKDSSFLKHKIWIKLRSLRAQLKTESHEKFHDKTNFFFKKLICFLNKALEFLSMNKYLTFIFDKNLKITMITTQ